MGNEKKQQRGIFKYVTREEFNSMRACEKDAYKKENSFNKLHWEEQDNFKIETKMIEKVLNSTGLLLDIPNTINGRTT